eukprot:3000097-Pyramimonas_sp.AAC.1
MSCIKLGIVTYPRTCMCGSPPALWAPSWVLEFTPLALEFNPLACDGSNPWPVSSTPWPVNSLISASYVRRPVRGAPLLIDDRNRQAQDAKWCEWWCGEWNIAMEEAERIADAAEVVWGINTRSDASDADGPQDERSAGGIDGDPLHAPVHTASPTPAPCDMIRRLLSQVRQVSLASMRHCRCRLLVKM